MDVASVVWVREKGLGHQITCPSLTARESDGTEIPRHVCLTSGLGSLREVILALRSCARCVTVILALRACLKCVSSLLQRWFVPPLTFCLSTSGHVAPFYFSFPCSLSPLQRRPAVSESMVYSRRQNRRQEIAKEKGGKGQGQVRIFPRLLFPAHQEINKSRKRVLEARAQTYGQMEDQPEFLGQRRKKNIAAGNTFS